MQQKTLSRGIAITIVAFIAVAVVMVVVRRESRGRSAMEDLTSTEQLKKRFQQDTAKVRCWLFLT